MPNAPQFKYFLYGAGQPVQPDSEICTTPIPLSRKPKERQAADFVSHGDYFSACRDFLAKDDFKTITFAVSQQIRRPVAVEELETIHIILEKHGEFYHPSKIETVLQGTTVSFVLNVAVSNAGNACIQREYRCLKRLHKEFPLSFVPKAYGEGHIYIKNNRKVGMFLGEWLEGFNEFHISRDPLDKKNKLVVWDSENGNFFLSVEQTLEIYRQAALILTYYYHVETLEQIFPWHHAAGDFVVKRLNNTLEVKLITVRQYVSMVKEHESADQQRDAEFILEALLVFLLNLSIRMRLDRLDGVGDIVWSNDIAVEGTLKGFFEGLALKQPIDLLPEPLFNSFRQHLLTCRETELFDLSQAMVKTYHPKAPEVPVIEQNLVAHVRIFYNAIRKGLNPG